MLDIAQGDIGVDVALIVRAGSDVVVRHAGPPSDYTRLAAAALIADMVRRRGCYGTCRRVILETLAALVFDETPQRPLATSV